MLMSGDDVWQRRRRARRTLAGEGERRESRACLLPGGEGAGVVHGELRGVGGTTDLGVSSVHWKRDSRQDRRRGARILPQQRAAGRALSPFLDLSGHSDGVWVVSTCTMTGTGNQPGSGERGLACVELYDAQAIGHAP